MEPFVKALALLIGTSFLVQAISARSFTDLLTQHGAVKPIFDALPAGCSVSLAGGPSRSDFPPDFIFGTATAAYQIEGAIDEGGRGPSIWDVYTKLPGKIIDKSDGKIACDSYHKYQEDVDINADLGMGAYRFSVSWSRVLPKGSGKVNPEGIAYYNRLIDALVAKGIKPAITLYHWDLPQALEENPGGWLSPSIVGFFREYADLCFRTFGDRVKTWITLNEPMETAMGGYGLGYRAPGRCSDRATCPEGDSSTEPYVVAHHLLLSHGAAVEVYRSKYQKQQGGTIGIVLNVGFNYPLTKKPADVEAAERAMVFNLGWFADPAHFGDYPAIMHEHAGGRLPKFTEEQKAQMRLSVDFLGLNYYTASYAYSIPPPSPEEANPYTDSWTARSVNDIDGKPIGDGCNSSWLYVVPESIYDMVFWVKVRYDNVAMLITENGISESTKAASVPVANQLCDSQRVHYHQDYLFHLARAIRDGARVRGYYAWSLLDNFEWAMGYTERFGIMFVDFEDPHRTRYAKASAVWWHKFLKGKKIASS
eukprot:TRINITY_DN38930_c0_g1_i1.p1 TRINITY_DN38930_c0_g1~~TRINITY_DN38930_c0_g1_i1.p1  ORF type:complete len:536 (-),score=89.05 TRINITY_DN38930_c0_g1_i1:393-2000(-)